LESLPDVPEAQAIEVQSEKSDWQLKKYKIILIKPCKSDDKML
jgi:hypothetical protein